MQNQKRGFQYVIARIDELEITGLAATKLWIDFSKQREGPAGTGLLSLLYGLRGQPLPPGAVKLAADVDAQMRDGLLSIRAARDAADADALHALAETDDMAWKGSPMLMSAVAEGLIAMKKIPEATAVLDRAEAAFPKALRPKQLRGLALARSGQTMQAQLVLGKLYAAGESRSGDARHFGPQLDGPVQPVGKSTFSPEVARSLPAGLRGGSERLLHRHQRGLQKPSGG